MICTGNTIETDWDKEDQCVAAKDKKIQERFTTCDHNGKRARQSGVRV